MGEPPAPEQDRGSLFQVALKEVTHQLKHRNDRRASYENLPAQLYQAQRPCALPPLGPGVHQTNIC
jgi:hypothetical protein